MSWSEVFKGGLMPDGKVHHFESEEEYRKTYFEALNEWLKLA